MSIDTELSDRCKRLLNFFADNNFHTRAEISLELNLTPSQITGTMELLKKRGYVFDAFTKNNLKHYKLSKQKLQPNTYAMTTKAVNERFAVELNRIRLLAIRDGVFNIERIARQALEAGGLHTD